MLTDIRHTFNAFRTRRLILEYDKIPFLFSGLEPGTLLNWFVAELSARLRLPFAAAYPTLFQIEPTNLCNLRCPMCFTSIDPRPRTRMPFDRYTRLIDEIAGTTLLLQLWGWGEPFMHRDFCSMIRYARLKGMRVITATNGHFFKSETDVDDLIDSQLDVLMFALDGVDADSYAKYRQRGDFDRVLRALELLIRRRDQRGAAFPLINLRMVMSRDNENQAERIVQLGAEIGADVLTFKTMWNINMEKAVEGLLPTNPSYRRAMYRKDGEAVRVRNRCRRFWNNPVVYRDGTVVPCYYHSADASVGKVFEHAGRGFRKVWFGRRFAKLRSDFVCGNTDGTPCAECALNFSQVDQFVSHAFWYRPHPDGIEVESTPL